LIVEDQGKIHLLENHIKLLILEINKLNSVIRENGTECQRLQTETKAQTRRAQQQELQISRLLEEITKLNGVIVEKGLERTSLKN